MNAVWYFLTWFIYWFTVFQVLQIVLTFLHNVSYRIHITGFWPDFNIRRWKWWWCNFGQEGKQASDRCLRPCFNISVTTWDVLTRPWNISTCVSGDRTTSTALSQHNIKKVGIKTSKVLNWVVKVSDNYLHDVSNIPCKLKLNRCLLSPGAIMISFFLERTRRKVRSFWGSISRTVLRAIITSCWISPAYCTVLG